MSACLIDFAGMPWIPGAHPLERKKAQGDVGLLRFAPGFADPTWCERSHVLYVLEGELTLELEHETLSIGSGQACRIEPGTPHRASNQSQHDALVLAISDLAALGNQAIDAQ
jgi:mannose-6-phosphate isomerase-like protein (cupin superfamily)